MQVKKIMMAVAMLLCSLSASGAYDDIIELDGLNYYVYHESKTVEVSAGWEVHLSSIVIPASVECNGENYQVAALTSSAFSGHEELVSVTIQAAISEIAQSAFYGCSNLKAIVLPQSITTIGENAFAGCSSLESFTVPNSVTKIDWGAFDDCTGLTYLNLGKGITEIANTAFIGCTNLNTLEIHFQVIKEQMLTGMSMQKLILGDEVTTLGDFAFSGCKKLQDLEIGTGLENIGRSPFDECDNLTSVQVNCATIKEGFIQHGIKNVTMGDNVSIIDRSAFSYCEEDLESVVIGSNVTTIGARAFSLCKALTSVHIPDKVQSIGDNAFSSCSSLTNVIIDCVSPEIGIAPFELCDAITSVTLHCTEVKDWFSQKENLTEVVLGDEVVTIGDNAFSYCKNLATINFPPNLRSIGDHAFSGCEKLTNIVIPAKIETIGSAFDNYVTSVTFHCPEINAWFKENTNLREVVIGEEVTTIKDEAFWYCSGLTTINIPANVQTVEGSPFLGCSGLTKVELHCNEVGEWFSRLENLQEVVLGDEVTSIGDYAFQDCNNLTKINFPKNLATIGEGAFGKCNLSSIELPNSLTSIDVNAFWGNENVQTVTLHCKNVEQGMSFGAKEVIIGDEVETIAGYAFYDDSNLTKVTIGSGVKSIGSYIFQGCSNLTTAYVDCPDLSCDGSVFQGLNIKEVTIGEHVRVIGDIVFYGCAQLETVVMGANVESIGYGAFNGCTMLKSILFPSTLETVGNYAFKDCSSLSSIVLDSSPSYGTSCFDGCEAITSIEYNCKNIARLPTYSNASSITNVVIGKNVKAIGEEAFRGFGITSIEIPEGVTSIGICAFLDCENLTSISIPEGMKTIGVGAFEGCISLTAVTIPSSVTEIGDHAFWNVPAVVTLYPENIGTWFQNNDAIREVILAEGVKTIAAEAFLGCSALESITIPASVVEIGENAFSNLNALATLKLYCKEVGDWFSGSSILKEVTIGDLAESIPANAFSDCSALEKVSLGRNIKSIGDYAFFRCSGLTEINFPQHLESIGKEAFEESGITAVEIPQTIKAIGIGAFENCDAITSVTFSCQEVGDWFSGLKGIKKIVIGDETTTISDYAFGGCSSLESVTLGKNLAKIGEYAFSRCSALTLIDIPQTVTEIGEGTFSDCSSLSSVIVRNEVPLDNMQIAFGGISDEAILYVPQGCKAAYEEAFSEYIIFKQIVELGAQDGVSYSPTQDGGVKIDKYSGTENQVAIPEKIIIDEVEYEVTAIADEAFKDNLELQEVTIPTSIKTIGANAFAGCENLKVIKNYNGVPVDLSAYQAASRTRASGATTVFAGVDTENCVLYVPASSRSQYASAAGWSEFKHIVMFGDVNRDDQLSVTDAVAIISQILDKSPANFDSNAADVNGDNATSVTDAVQVIDTILQQQ